MTNDHNCIPPTAAELIALAAAIAEPRQKPQFLKAGLSSAGLSTKLADGWAESIEHAVSSGRPFMVKARCDVLVIDDDSGANYASTFGEEYLGEYEFVMCESGQPGRWHLFVVVEDPAQRSYLVARAKEMGLADSSFGRWIRPPGAPHPAGYVSSLSGIDPQTAQRAKRSASRPGRWRPGRRRRAERARARRPGRALQQPPARRPPHHHPLSRA